MTLDRHLQIHYSGFTLSCLRSSPLKIRAAMARPLRITFPLEEVVGSTLLGGAEFVALIKDTYLARKKPDKNVPALTELSEKASLKDIFDAVEAVTDEDPSLARNIKLYLVRRYTGEKLKDIGNHFGIGESGVSKAYRRIFEKIPDDKKLRNKIEEIVKKLNLSRIKT